MSSFGLDVWKQGIKKISTYGLDVRRQRSGRMFNHSLGGWKHRIEKMPSYILGISTQGSGNTTSIIGTGKVPGKKKSEKTSDKPTSTIVMSKIQ